MEYTALKMFAQVAERQSQHGIQLWLIGMNPEVLAIVQRSPLGQMLRREGMHFNLEIAISNFLATAGNEFRSYRAFELMQCFRVDVAPTRRTRCTSRMRAVHCVCSGTRCGACTRGLALAAGFVRCNTQRHGASSFRGSVRARQIAYGNRWSAKET